MGFNRTNASLHHLKKRRKPRLGRTSFFTKKLYYLVFLLGLKSLFLMSDHQTLGSGV